MPGVPAVTPAGRGFTDSVCVSISSNRIRRLAPESQTRDLTGGFGAAPEHPASPGLWRGLLAGSPSTAAARPPGRAPRRARSSHIPLFWSRSWEKGREACLCSLARCVKC